MDTTSNFLPAQCSLQLHIEILPKKKNSKIKKRMTNILIRKWDKSLIYIYRHRAVLDTAGGEINIISVIHCMLFPRKVPLVQVITYKGKVSRKLVSSDSFML